MLFDLYPCPCCGYLVHDEPPGSYNICQICFWEDDSAQLRYPEMTWGPNRVCLIEAQKNFAAIGANEESALAHVRLPTAKDQRDPQWRPINPSIDKYEYSDAGRKSGNYFPEGTEEYYWRKS